MSGAARIGVVCCPGVTKLPLTSTHVPPESKTGLERRDGVEDVLSLKTCSCSFLRCSVWWGHTGAMVAVLCTPRVGLEVTA